METGAPVHKKNVPQYNWGEVCKSWVLTDLPGLSVKQEKMPAGAKEQLHYHRETIQFFFILKGIAVFYVDGKKIELNEQEGLLIENNKKHFVINESSVDIEFLVISQPNTGKDRVNIPFAE